MTETTIAVIGAGQLGSRHLQGLKKAQIQMNIHVLDASEESLSVCRQRYNDIPDNELVKKIQFTTQWESLPDVIDIAIVATGSTPRCSIIHELVEKHHCRRLILEKFLFPKMSQYDEIASLFQEHDVKAWVNCSRRYFTVYQDLRDLLIQDGPIDFLMKGKNWGLCCNSIHFIDLFAYLTGEKNIHFDCSGIDPHINESKRPGYIEMTGTIKGKSDNGSTLQLGSYSDFEGGTTFSIESKHHKVEIFEGQNKIVVDGSEQAMNLSYQSDLTGKYIEDLVNKHQLVLATFTESANLHQQILPYFLDIYNKITGLQSDLCPIT